MKRRTYLAAAPIGLVIAGALFGTSCKDMAAPARTVTLSVFNFGEGSGTVSAAAIDLSCSATQCDVTVPRGTTVTLSQQAALGSAFDSWSESVCSTAPTCSILMDRSRSISAWWELLPPTTR